MIRQRLVAARDAWLITPDVMLPLPSGSGVTGVSSSRRNENRPKTRCFDPK